MDVISRKLVIEGVDVAITDHRGLADEIKNVKKLLDDPKLGEQAYGELNKKLATLQESQREYRKDLRRGGQEAITQGKVTVSAYRKMSTQLNVSRNRLKDYLAAQANGVKLTKIQEKEVEKLTKQVSEYDKKLKDIDRSVGQNFRNVGNYTSALEGIQKRLIGAFSIGAVVSFGAAFIRQLQEIATEAKGVEFAFERIQGGADALTRIQQSTRGLLSELDIKRSIVEFDNFNLSLKEADSLFEFVALRATQTGTSFDKLLDSLVEGLSKSSLRRLDNLGISMDAIKGKMNEFGLSVNDAFTELAKAEIAEAGDILDGAANSTQKLNVAYQNFQLSVVNGSGAITSAFFGIQNAASGILNTLTQINQGRFNSFDDIFNPSKIKESNDRLFEMEQTLRANLTTNEAVNEFFSNGGFNTVIEAYKEADFTVKGATDKAAAFFKALAEDINAEPIKEVSKEVEELDKKIKKVAEPEKGSMSQLKNAIAAINKEINDGNLQDATLIAKLEEIERLEKSITDLEDRRRRLQSGDRTVEGVASIGGIGLPSSLDSQSAEQNTEDIQSDLAKDNKEKIVQLERDKTEEIATELEKQRDLYNQNALEVGEILGKLFTGNAENAKEGLKELGVFILDQLEKQILANIASIQASAITSAFIDPTALLRGAAQIAVVKGLFAAVKSQIAERGAIVDSNGNVKGKRHSNGGENVSIHGQNWNIEQGERLMQDETGAIAVINRNANSMNRGLLDSFGGIAPRAILSKINQSGGGIPFAERGALIGSVAPRPSQNDIFQNEFNNGQVIAEAVRAASLEGTREGSKEGLNDATVLNRKISTLQDEKRF